MCYFLVVKKQPGYWITLSITKLHNRSITTTPLLAAVKNTRHQHTPVTVRKVGGRPCMWRNTRWFGRFFFLHGLSNWVHYTQSALSTTDSQNESLFLLHILYDNPHCNTCLYTHVGAMLSWHLYYWSKHM